MKRLPRNPISSMGFRFHMKSPTQKKVNDLVWRHASKQIGIQGVIFNALNGSRMELESYLNDTMRLKGYKQ